MEAVKEKLLEEMLSLIRKEPGIRPKDLHKKLNLKHSWNLRAVLIKKFLVKKKRVGAAVHYFPMSQNENK
jgi:hypothetical protein